MKGRRQGRERKSARELYDEYIKVDWPQLFREGGEVQVKKSDGSRYVPTQWAIGLLRTEVNAFDEAIKAWSTPSEGEAVSGYDRIIAEAGPEYTWEGILIDPGRPWASAVPQNVRDNIRADLERRSTGVLAYQG